MKMALNCCWLVGSILVVGVGFQLMRMGLLGIPIAIGFMLIAILLFAPQIIDYILGESRNDNGDRSDGD